MSEEQLDTCAFVFLEELGRWKIVKFDWNNVHAIRSCGEVVVCSHEDDARAIPRRRAAKALIARHHAELAKS